MAKGLQQQQAGGQNLPADVTALIDQLERHCLAPDGSLVSKSAYYDLQLVPQTKKKKKLCFFPFYSLFGCLENGEKKGKCK